MANKLTKANLVEEILIKLEGYNKRRVILDGETVLGDVLSNDFPGVPPIKNLFKGAMKWTIASNGGKIPKFPSNWTTYTVNDFAEFIMSNQ